METLLVSTAISLVRKNLDELDANGSLLLSQDGDNSDMNLLIAKNLPEAINTVHAAAPARPLEGVVDSLSTGTKIALMSATADGVVLFKIAETEFLRLVALRAKDSYITVTDALPEASPEGRKQFNPYVRGTFDRPRLVRRQLRDSGYPVFWYFTMSSYWMAENAEGLDNDENAGTIVSTNAVSTVFSSASYILRLTYNENSPATGYSISPRLRQNIIDYLTGLVMVTYNDNRAEGFFTRANNF